MKLVVDVGNSRLKWAEVEANVPRKGQSIALSEPMEGLLDVHWKTMAPPDCTLISNVSGQENAKSISSWMQRHWNRNPVFFQSDIRFGGMENGYKKVQQLGCDRWAALIGARSITAVGPLCVVDCGTAVTIDTVTAENRFIGGVIIPGIDLMQQSLLMNTSDILESRAECKQVVGKTTAECVSSGSFFGIAGAVDRILHEMSSVVGEAKLYITGGDAPQLLPLISYSLQYEPDLVLIGLAHSLMDSR